MERRAWVLVQGAVCHVCNRLTLGARLFTSRKPVERPLDILRQERGRDRLALLACCLRLTHYRLALRTGAVPISRTTGLAWSGSAHDHTGRFIFFFPLWQSRYKADLVSGERSLLTRVTHVTSTR